MTEPTESSAVKAYEYAVNDLGLNRVYEECIMVREELGNKTLELSSARERKRNLESAKQDREIELIEEERTRHTDMSVAAMEKHLKIVFSNDEDIRERREGLASVTGEIDLLEMQIKLLNRDIEIATSRMNELGGYFQFMAIIKQVDETEKAKKIISADPWRTQ